MKKITTISAVTTIALLVASTASAVVIFDDQFAVTDPVAWTFAGAADESVSLDTDLAARQAGGAISSTYSSDFIGGGSGVRTGGTSGQAIFRTGGIGSTANAALDHNFGTDVAASQWSVSVTEKKTGGSNASYTYLLVDTVLDNTSGIGAAAGSVAIEGYSNGRLDLWVNGAEVGTLFGLGITSIDYTYTLNFDEVAQTVQGVAAAAGNTYDLGTYSIAGVFGSGDRYIEKRNYVAGGGAATDSYVSNLTVDVIPEPATLGLFAMVGGGMLWMRKRFTI